jgi:GT2 family glycosyltransferase
MKSAILILSVDEATNLIRCLPLAAAQGASEVVVIDNACTDDTAAIAESHGARVVTLPRRASYAAALNLGLAALDAEAVLVLNADCFLDPGALAAMVAHLDDEHVGSVTPKLRRTDAPDRIDAAGMSLNRRRRNGLVGHGAKVGRYAVGGPAFGADGACALYRMAMLRDCALPDVFDEDLALWTTDADLGWRAQLLGWTCWYEPAATGSHKRTYSSSTRAQVSEAHRRLQFKNRYLMWFKNETAAGLLRDLPVILAWEALAFAYVLLRERHLLRAYGEIRAGLPAARARRRLVQARRRGAAPFGLRPPGGKKVPGTFLPPR